MGDLFIFIKNLFKYNRDVDDDYEQIWDLMICGRAADAKAHQSHPIFNLLMYIVDLVINFLVFAIFVEIKEGGTNNIVLIAVMFLFLTVSYFVCRCLPLKGKLKFIVSVIAAAVVGLIFGIVLLII